MIVFPEEELSDPNGSAFVLSVDCRDVKCWEKKHPWFNIDKRHSPKKNGFRAGLKHEIALNVHTDQIAWINGPFKAMKSDLTVFRSSLKQRFLAAFSSTKKKFTICDLGRRTLEENWWMLAIPCSTDKLKPKKHKSLARCHQEDINSCFANCKIL